MDIPGIIREARDSLDFLIKLPDKVMRGIFGPQLTFYSLKKRVAVLKDIVQLREVAKLVQELYMTKGDICAELEALKRCKKGSDISHLRERIEFIPEQLKYIRKKIAGIGLAKTKDTADVLFHLGRIIKYYDKINKMTDAELGDKEHVAELYVKFVKLAHIGTEWIAKLDQERKILDHTYG